MAGRIPQSFIDDLIARIDIVDLIDARVPLKKAGKNYQACCPFHNEKTPSFTVSPDKQFYHCFGCGAHGTAIGFLMEYERMDFVEAIEELASMLNLEVPREATPGRAQSTSKRPSRDLYALLEQVAGYYRQQLRHHPQAQRAVDYLKGRGLSGEIARDFAIGYAPPGWDNLLKALGHAEELIETGMVIDKREEKKRYDRFRDRIMFPIRDRRGRVIAFGGRVLGDDTPKYLNSPETPLFHKGQELYGLYEARQANRDLHRLLVVEGYMDVVALAQFGVRNAVATLGTALTPDHLSQLFRVTSEVVFCFDGDRAGREAAGRGLENALPLMEEGRQIRFMFLPEGEDPDTLIRKIGAEAFEAEVARAEPLSDFLINQLRQQADLQSVEGRARLIELAKPYLSRIPAGIYRRMLAERLAPLARMELNEMLVLLGLQPQAPRPAPSQGGEGKSKRPTQRQSPSLVRRAITILLQQPQLASLGGDMGRFGQLQLPGLRLLIELVEFLRLHPNVSTAAILEHWREREEGRHLLALAGQELLLDDDNDDLAAEFTAILDELARLTLQQRHDQLLEKYQQAGLSAEEKSEFQQLVSKMRR